MAIPDWFVAYGLFYLLRPINIPPTLTKILPRIFRAIARMYNSRTLGFSSIRHTTISLSQPRLTHRHRTYIKSCMKLTLTRLRAIFKRCYRSNLELHCQLNTSCCSNSELHCQCLNMRCRSNLELHCQCLNMCCRSNLELHQKSQTLKQSLIQKIS